MKRSLGATTLIASLLLAMQMGGCSTAPKGVDRGNFIAEAETTTSWFSRNVAGLDEQIQGSAGYIVFPDVAQWGILFSGGTWGRGALLAPDGRQIGWSAINAGSIGLQAGVQGFKMLLVLENQAALDKFMANDLTGSVSGVAVVAQAGGSGKASFTDGVAAYQGANTGLMAGVNVGLEYIRYKPLGAE